MSDAPKVLFSPPFQSATETDLKGNFLPARHFYIEGLGFGTVYASTTNAISDEMVDIGALYEKVGTNIFWCMITAEFDDPSSRAQDCMDNLISVMAENIVAASAHLDSHLKYYGKPAYPAAPSEF